MINFNLKTQLSWRELSVRSAFVVITMAVIVWFMPRNSHQTFIVEKGSPWRSADLTAPFEFPVFKSESTLEKERQERLNEFIPYFVYNDDVANEQVSHLRERIDNFPSLLQGSFRIMMLNRLRALYKSYIVEKKPTTSVGGAKYVIKVVDNYTHLGDTVALDQLLTPRDAYEQLLHDPSLKRYEAILRELNLNDFIVPNFKYDSLINQRAIDDLRRSVAPSSMVVKQGQRIISRGEIVDDDTYQMLESYQMELEKRHSDHESAMNAVGQALYVLIFILFFTIYLGIYRKDYFSRLRSACMLYTLIVIFVVMASILVDNGLMHVYILPFAAVPIFVRVFMDSRTAFFTHMTVVLITACMLHYPLEFIAVQMAAGMAVIFCLRELSSRSQLFWTAAIFILVAIATRFALFLIKQGDLTKIDARDYYYLAICGIIVFCSYPLLYVIEKTFGFVSDITLVELSNTNKDLLRRMSEEAPGTFNHSIQVGNLAAEIARKIDGNAQLVRTGALYHDIGKLQNPIYFTENQSGGISPHEHLSYIDSAQYIIGHVTEGLKLADKYHLPRQIRDFIATHHGQGKAKYFYVKYKNENPDEPVDDLLFTYPGPNPFTKEQAILMMADSVEAASRSLPDYTEQSIRQLVERIIDGMVSEGFFRECPITFRDIQYSKTVLIEKLKTIYHTRISYPEAKK